MMRLPIVLVVLAVVAGGARARGDDEAFHRHVMVLSEHGVAADAVSIGAYLRALQPDSDARKRQKELIDALGDDDYFARESAMAALMRLPVVSPELLQSAAASNNPEIRWRARHVLKRADDRATRILHAAFEVIRLKQLKGLGREVLASLAFCGDDYLRRAATNALEATVTPGDAGLLRDAIKGNDTDARVAALKALQSALGEDALGDVRPLLNDSDERVRLAACRALADYGRRDVLAVLGGLLGSDELETRLEAVRTLRAYTGRRFDFLAYEPDEKRSEAQKKWLAWIDGPGRTSRLFFPLKTRRFELGLTLFCSYSSNMLYELDQRQEVRWKTTTGRHPWACQGLPNGHRLVASYSDRTIVEYDRSGEKVWSHGGLPGGPMSVERLANGNTLVACTDSHKVVEIARDGKTVWEATVVGRPVDARRLENGRTLVALQNGRRIVEIDRAGSVVWEITGVDRPFSAQRLENGNTLVALYTSGTVAEYDRSGKVVWSQTGFRYCYTAQRLANGNTLVSWRNGVAEIDRDGRRAWTKAFANVSKAHRY